MCYSTRTPKLFSFLTAAGLLAATCFAQLQPGPSSFHIAIIDGEGALNNVEGRLAREPIIQVEDKNHKRVQGAYVEFDTPNVPGKPGAVFADGSTKLIAMTDAAGHVSAAGLQNNHVTGQFDINVTVRYQGQVVATGVIHQTNVCKKMAHVSRTLELNPTGHQSAPPLPPGMAGVAVGQNMMVNGSSIPGNANLPAGAQLQTLNSPVRVFLGNNCQFLIGPNSVATVNASGLSLAKGAARSEPFGNCSMDSHGLKVQGEDPTAEGVVRVTDRNLEVGSLNGNVRVLDSKGALKNVVNPCDAALLALLPTGAAAAGGGLSLGAGLGIAAAAGALSAVPVILSDDNGKSSTSP